MRTQFVLLSWMGLGLLSLAGCAEPRAQRAEAVRVGAGPKASARMEVAGQPAAQVYIAAMVFQETVNHADFVLDLTNSGSSPGFAIAPFVPMRLNQEVKLRVIDGSSRNYTAFVGLKRGVEDHALAEVRTPDATVYVDEGYIVVDGDHPSVRSPWTLTNADNTTWAVYLDPPSSTGAILHRIYNLENPRTGNPIHVTLLASSLKFDLQPGKCVYISGDTVQQPPAQDFDRTTDPIVVYMLARAGLAGYGN